MINNDGGEFTAAAVVEAASADPGGARRYQRGLLPQSGRRFIFKFQNSKFGEKSRRKKKTKFCDSTF